MKDRVFYFGFALLLVLVILFLYFAIHPQVFGQMDDEWAYATPTPVCTPTPTALPTPTIQVSPPPMPTSTLTANGGAPSNGGGGSNSPQGSTTNAPGSPTCTIVFTPPVLTSIVAGQSGQVTFTWLDSETATNKFAVTYGYSPTVLPYGVDNIPASSRSVTVGDLTPGANVFGKVWGFENRCAETSNILDPVVN